MNHNINPDNRDANNPLAPWNNDAEPESDEYDCAGCYDCKVQMSKPGEICTECLMYIAEYA